MDKQGSLKARGRFPCRPKDEEENVSAALASPKGEESVTTRYLQQDEEESTRRSRAGRPKTASHACACFPNAGPQSGGPRGATTLILGYITQSEAEFGTPLSKIGRFGL